MQKRSIHVLAISLSAATVPACSTFKATEPASDVHQDFQSRLPVIIEPSFERTHSGMFQSGTQVTYLVTGPSVEETLKDQFPVLRSPGGSLNQGWEDFVLSNGSTYRRTIFHYKSKSDLEAPTMHGPCSQGILVWFTLQGEIKGVYTQPKSCP